MANASALSRVLALKSATTGINPMLLSVLSVVLIVLIMPIVMGGTIALTVALAGENLNAQTPDDFNTGVDIPDPFAGCSQLQNPTPSTSLVVFDDVNWTALGTTNCAANSGTITPTGQTSVGAWNLSFPSGVLASEGTLSRFAVELISANYCDVNSTCAQGWLFDWRLRINGTVVFGVDDDTSAQRRRVGGTTPHYYAYHSINYSLNAFDEIALREEMKKCNANETSGGDCVATIEFDGVVKKGGGTSNTCHPVRCSNGFRVRVITYDTSADTSSLLLRASAWLLGGVLTTMAVAATPWWTPTTAFISGQVKGGRGSTFPGPGGGRRR